MKTTFTLLFLLFYISVSGQQRNWLWINPAPQGNTLQAITSVGNTGNLVTVGANGTVLLSQDFGTNWASIKTPLREHLWDVQFLNNTTGYAVSDKGTIVKTTTGGNNWVSLQQLNYRLFAVHFISEEIGFVAGGALNRSTNTNEQYLFKTEDGGATWTNILHRPGDPFKKIDFIDENFGFAISFFARELVLTYDGGKTWITKPLPPGYSVNDAVFTDKDHGALLEGSWPIKVRVTKDGGNTWIDAGNAQYGEIGAISKDVLYHSGESGIYISKDGGLTWQKKLNGKAQLQDIFVKDTLNAVGVGYSGDIYKADFETGEWVNMHKNIDQTYQQNLNFHSTIKSLHFPSASTGYAGIYYNSGSIALMKTVNGGCDWENIKTFYNTGFYTYFLSEDVGFVSSGNENYTQTYIHKTIDGGKTWQQCPLPGSTSIITTIYFVNETIGYAVSASGEVLRSNDGGLSWAETSDAVGLCCNQKTDLYFTGANVGFAVNGTNKILKTQDGAQTWQRVYTNSAIAIKGITFTDENVGFAVAGNGEWGENSKGYILQTVDGGQNWAIIKETAGELVAMNFLDEKSGYAVGAIGNIYYTEDGGKTWKAEESQTRNSLNQVFNTEDGTIYIWGKEQSTLLKKPVHPEAIFTPGNTVICQDETITFHNQSISSYNFNWQANGTTFSTEKSPSHKFTAPGTYTITLLADNCGYQDEVQHTITVLPLPEKPVIIAEGVAVQGKTYIVCDKPVLQLSTSATYTAYEWVYRGGTSNSPTLQSTQNDTLYVKVQGDNGCYNVSDTLIVQFKNTPVAAFEAEQKGLEVAFKNTSQSGETYSWDFGDGNFSNEPAPTHVFTDAGVYPVKLSVNNYCGENIMEQELEVRQPSLDLDVVLYPNPVETILTISHTNGVTPPTTILLTDVLGRTVTLNAQSSVYKSTVDLSNYRAGIYFLKLVWPQGTRTIKLVKR